MVRRVEGSDAIVEVTEQLGGCGRCDEPGGCRGGILARPLGGVCREYRVPNGIAAGVGETVGVQVADGAAGRVALIVYGLPVAALLIGAAIGPVLWRHVDSDTAAMAGAFVGFACALGFIVWARRWSWAWKSARPTLVRRSRPQ